MKNSLRLGTLALGMLALSLAHSGNAADRDRDGKPPLPAPATAHGNPVTRGKTPPALAAPVIASCGEADGNATATWGAVEGATKYSVEFVVGYDLTGADGCADAFLEFEYSTTDTTITVPLTDFDNNFCDEVTPCVASPVSITVRVKGLNPPSGGPKGSGAPQNNPFSALCVVQADACVS
ncbi:MAG TPA: hypothetical protein VKF32_04240 [Thermoanaerobaculia bacterium]|nr:hypothetical protein [Thermoanaerobaculia bacterium]